MLSESYFIQAGKLSFCYIKFKRNVKIYFCYFKEIRSESHDYPHRVAKFPENRNRNRYRDVSPCKYSWRGGARARVCVCVCVCVLVCCRTQDMAENVGVKVDEHGGFFFFFVSTYIRAL